MVTENIMDVQSGVGQYKQVKISIDPDLAATFKSACASSNASMASILSQFMTEYCGIARQSVIRHKPSPDYSTRRKRRIIVRRIIHELEQIKSGEEALIDNAHPNLKDAPIYEVAEEYIAAVDEAIEQLSIMVP